MKLRRPFNGNYRLSQGFGLNPDMYKPMGLDGHNGLDYALPQGTPVVAALDGKVTEVGLDTSGYGTYAKIENADQGQIYGHFSRIDVKVGDEVYEGQQIGLSGGAKGTWGAGFSTGAHLHWGYWATPRNRSNGYAGYIDQAELLISRDEQAALPVGRTYISTNGGTIPVQTKEYEKLVNMADKWAYTVLECLEIKDRNPVDVNKEDVRVAIVDTRNQLNEANRRLDNLKDQEVDGHKVGWYITELTNRVDQVNRLKDEIKAYSDQSTAITTIKNQLDEKAKALGEANIKIEELESDKRTLQTNIDNLTNKITQLETDLKTEQEKPKSIGVETMSIYDAFIYIVNRVIETLKGTKITA